MIEAETIDEAMDIIDNKQIDGALLDIKIEVVNEKRDGIDVAKHIQAKHNNRVAIFFLSAYKGDKHILERANETSPIKFIGKAEVDLDEINLELERALANRLEEEEDDSIISQNGYFCIPTNQKVNGGWLKRKIILHVEKVNYIKSSEGITTFYTDDGEYQLTANANPIINQLQSVESNVLDVLFLGKRGTYININKVVAFGNGHVYFDLNDNKGISVNSTCLSYLKSRYLEIKHKLK